MSSEITFEWMRTEEQWKKLEEFAESFPDGKHKIVTRSHPICALKSNGEWVGYAQVVSVPVVFPAWHPTKCSPRQVLEGMRAFLGWTRIQHGFGMIATPTDNNNKFTPSIMEKLGVKRMFAELWEAIND